MLRLLEGYIHVFSIAQFLEVWNTGIFEHGWWATHEDLCVWTGGREVGRNHLITDEPSAVPPTSEGRREGKRGRVSYTLALANIHKTIS